MIYPADLEARQLRDRVRRILDAVPEERRKAVSAALSEVLQGCNESLARALVNEELCITDEIKDIVERAAAYGFHQTAEIFASAPRPAWLVEEIWPEGGVGMIVGAAKSCKTMVGVDLAISVDTGTPFLGRFAVGLPGPVIYVYGDPDAGAVPARAEKLYRCRGLPSENGRVFTLPRCDLRLDSPESRERLKNVVRDIRPRMLIIDPLVEVGGLSTEAAYRPARDLMGYLRSLAEEYEVAVVVAHRASHGQARKERRVAGVDVLRGLVALQNRTRALRYNQRRHARASFGVCICPGHETAAGRSPWARALGDHGSRR